MSILPHEADALVAFLEREVANDPREEAQAALATARKVKWAAWVTHHKVLRLRHRNRDLERELARLLGAESTVAPTVDDSLTPEEIEEVRARMLAKGLHER